MRKERFEGWYFRCNAQGESLAVIVGRSCSEKGHAFIQVFKSKCQESYYISFPNKAFYYDESPLYIEIGDNVFTEKYMELHIKEKNLNLEGIVYFGSFTKLSPLFFAKGLMGPFGFLSFMECYHDVLSMNHKLTGSMNLNGQILSFENGKGYIERDWGTSFPSRYVWIQCNEFNKEELSVMVALADIPFLGMSFSGFLCCLNVKGKVRVFATYTGARFKVKQEGENNLSIEIRQGREKLVLKVRTEKGNLLKAPQKGLMKREIYETLEGELDLFIYYNEGLKAYAIGKQVGIEQVGEIEKLYS